MAQPQYNDTAFVALNNEVFDITITVFDAGVFSVELDGGPYTGSGATITLIRDALLTSIQGGTHPNYSAAAQATDAIRITASGPAEFIGGTPNCTVPKLTAPGSGAMTKTTITAHEGIVFGVLEQAILNDVAILTPLEHLRTAFEWVDLSVSPRVLQINFTVDPLPGPEKTALDALVAAYTNIEIVNLLAQMFRTSTQDVGFVHLGADFALVSKGSPDNGAKLLYLGGAASAGKTYITGLRAFANQPADVSEVTIDEGECMSESGDAVIALTSPKTIDIDTSGAGGLDTGSKANSTWYAVYIIAKDDGTTSGLFSLVYEPTGPTMPTGYTQRRYIGDVLTDSGGAIQDYRIYGNGNEIFYIWSQSRIGAPFRVKSSGASTTWSDIDLSGVVPITAHKVKLVTTNQNSPTAYLRESDVDGGGGIDQPFGSVRISGSDTDNPEMGVDTDREVQYMMSSSGGALHVDAVGYEVHR